MCLTPAYGRNYSRRILHFEVVWVIEEVEVHQISVVISRVIPLIDDERIWCRSGVIYHNQPLVLSSNRCSTAIVFPNKDVRDSYYGALLIGRVSLGIYCLLYQFSRPPFVFNEDNNQ